jgi:hypothetical protein
MATDDRAAYDQPARGPDHRWTVLGYTFAIYTFRDHPQRWHWEASAHGRGVGGHRTPVGAFFALRRWLRVPARPS